MDQSTEFELPYQNHPNGHDIPQLRFGPTEEYFSTLGLSTLPHPLYN